MAASRQEAESPDAFRSPNPHGQRLATRPRILLAAEPRPQPRPVSRRTRARGTPGRQKAKAGADPSRKKDLGVARAPLLSHGLLLPSRKSSSTNTNDSRQRIEHAAGEDFRDSFFLFSMASSARVWDKLFSTFLSACLTAGIPEYSVH